METTGNGGRSPHGDWRQCRAAMTLIEVLVVIAIATLLMSMLLPALSAAREASRTNACLSNLRQFGVGLSAHAMTHGTLCSGAFDWRHDGCVTEKGWVADLVAQGTPVGQMLCRSNAAQISETFNDLVGMESSIDNCVDRLGSPTQTAPDGSLVTNPCRAAAAMAVGTDSRRQELVEQQIYDKYYNTNYTPTWFLVRTGVSLDNSGNLKTDKAACPASLLSTHATQGPLTTSMADTATAPTSFVPLLGCGAPAGTLTVPIASLDGKPAVRTMTRGPVLKSNLQPPSFPLGTQRTGPDGWWKTWNNDTLQDYRDFGPVHRGMCNVLFADGSARSLLDANKDGLLNNGFSQASGGGFTSDTVELAPDQVFSGWSLRAR